MTMRDAVLELHKDLSRRSFFTRTVKVAGIAAFFDKYGERALAQSQTDPLAVYSALGSVIIPVDNDPGWTTFDPGISDYGLNKFVPNVLLGGNPVLFQGVVGTIIALNDLPPALGFSTTSFLNMSEQLRSSYYGDILSGQFENYGAQDVLFLAAFVALFSCKAVFFSNYPNHLAVQNSEFQILPTTGPKTGWQMMGYKGPVGPAEEAALRARYANVEVLPGVDPTNPYI